MKVHGNLLPPAVAALLCTFATAMIPTSAAVADTPWDGVRAWETAKVTRVVDGDTILVKDEITGAGSRIRVIGLNAPEIHECGGPEAKKVLEELAPKGTRVRLASSYRESKGKARPLRVVLAENRETGEFDHDLGWAIAGRGLGVWYTQKSEPVLSGLYRAVVDDAQAREVGIWGKGFCGTGTDPEVVLSLRIGRNDTGTGGEWVVVRNTGNIPIDISGWMLRDSGLRGRYVFPGGSYLIPGDYRTVHTGNGTAGKPDGHDVYNGYKGILYPEPSARFGDGVYLLDTSGAFRSWREYPCTLNCETDSAEIGYIRPSNAKKPTGGVSIRNPGMGTVCLDGYLLETGKTRVRLSPGVCITPGGELTVPVAELEKHGMVTLSSDTGSELGRKYW